jgi:hypothetical protein
MGDATGEAAGSGLRVAFDRRLKLEFHGASVTSDSSLLAFRELDDALGLTAMAADVLTDPRSGRNGRHSLIAQLRDCSGAPMGVIPNNSHFAWPGPLTPSVIVRGGIGYYPSGNSGSLVTNSLETKIDGGICDHVLDNLGHVIGTLTPRATCCLQAGFSGGLPMATLDLSTLGLVPPFHVEAP